MRDEFTFLKRLDIGEARRQTDVKEIDRQRRQPQQHDDKRKRNPNDALFELRDA
jgi:hypothetical protein